MEAWLEQESEKLKRSWMRHDADELKDYLVEDVEDPRLNLQSVLSRHFLVRAAIGDGFEELMERECGFAAVMNWLCGWARRPGAVDESELILHALIRGADNAEGTEIPHFVLRSFEGLTRQGTALGRANPNYIEDFLRGVRIEDGHLSLHEGSLNTFQGLWRRALETEGPERAARRARAPGSPGGCASESAADQAKPSVIEPACGSANDYRYLNAYGIARRLDYTGFDLCPTNVENALRLFPGIRFEAGNVFEIRAGDRGYELCIVQDLFEHLSPKGLAAAVRELCRVTRRSLCVGFFNMDEAEDHRIRPVEDYYWNTLSVDRMKELFAGHGFRAQVIHIGTFLRRQLGCEHTHNPNAYTFLLWRERG